MYTLSNVYILYILGCFLFPKLTVEENTGSNMILQVIKLFSKKKIFTYSLIQCADLQMKIGKNQEKGFKNVLESFQKLFTTKMF